MDKNFVKEGDYIYGLGDNEVTGKKMVLAKVLDVSYDIGVIELCILDHESYRWPNTHVYSDLDKITFGKYEKSSLNNNVKRKEKTAMTQKENKRRLTGIIRRIDDLGRVVIPKEIRRACRIAEGDPLEISIDNSDGVPVVCLVKYECKDV